MTASCAGRTELAPRGMEHCPHLMDDDSARSRHERVGITVTRCCRCGRLAALVSVEAFAKGALESPPPLPRTPTPPPEGSS